MFDSADPSSRVPAHDRSQHDPLDAPVSSIMTRGVIARPAADTLLEAARAMTANRVHAIVVRDAGAGSSFGVLSDRDLLDALGLGAATGDEEIGSLASTEPLAIAADAGARQAAELMREHEVAHLFVIEPGTGEPVGVVSSLDLARLLVGGPRGAQAPARVVVGHDGAAGGDDAVALARLLAGAGGEVHALMAVPFPPRQTGDPPITAEAEPGSWAEQRDALIESGRAVLQRRALERLTGIEGSAEAVVDNSPAAALATAVESERPDFVVVGSSAHGRIGRVLAGSTGERLAHGSPSPVAIAPRGYGVVAPERIGRISVGCAHGPDSEHALELAAGLARRFDAELHVVRVVEPSVSQAALIADGRDVLAGHGLGAEPKVRARAELEALVAARGRDLDVEVEVERGPVAELLIEHCRRVQPDLLVVGSRRYGPLARVLLGSVSMRMVREAPCPVVVSPRTGS